MLIRHTIYYLILRGGPGLLNFAALVIYTRLLTPASFGRYAVVVATIGLVEAVFFQWLRLIVLRYLPMRQSDPDRFLAGIMSLFLAISVFVSGVGGILALSWPDPTWQRLIAIAVPLLIAQAGTELTLTIARARLALGIYGRLLGTKSFLSIVVGGLLAWIGLGAFAPIIGLLAGHFLAIVAYGLALWQKTSPRWPARNELREHLRYGLPLIVTFALSWVVSASDRLMLGWLAGEAAAGVYAVGYDLAQQSLGLLLVIINTAAFPIVMEALKTGDHEAAREQLVINGDLVTGIALMGAAGLATLAPQITDLFIGAAYRAAASSVLPWIAIGAAIAGIKAYHLDMAFHLGVESRKLAATTLAAAVANVVLNFALIPGYGVAGSAVAMVIAFSIAAAGSLWLGRKAFPLPPIGPMLLRGGTCAAAVWAGARLGVNLLPGHWALASAMTLGVLAGGVAALATNTARVRYAILARWPEIVRRIF